MAWQFSALEGDAKPHLFEAEVVEAEVILQALVYKACKITLQALRQHNCPTKSPATLPGTISYTPNNRVVILLSVIPLNPKAEKGVCPVLFRYSPQLHQRYYAFNPS